MFKMKKNKENVTNARELAIKCHGGQKYGQHPYLYHLDMVANIAIEAGLDSKYIVACYLHDIIEDTMCTLEEVRENFGVEVMDMVYYVTDELGRTREERKNKTYSKLKGETDGTIIKLCDRIANIRFSSKNSKKKCLMYIKEDPVFRELEEEIYYSDFYKIYSNLWRLYGNAIAEACDSLTNNH